MASRRPTRRKPGEVGLSRPTPFLDACDALAGLATRPEFELHETPAPAHVAPHAFALSAEGVAGPAEGTSGRLVLLHDPDGQTAWEGTSRFVTFVRANVELEMAADPAVTEVVWSWWRDSLDDCSAAWHAESGTVTRTNSQSFGGLAGRGVVGEVEIRGSWTPSDDDVAAHGSAWLDLLARLSGLAPIPPGVTQLGTRSMRR